MADDLSARAAGAMWATGQGAGNVTDHDRAMTAPGTRPSAVAAGDGLDEPRVAAEHFAASNQVDGGDEPYGGSWELTTGRDWPR